MAYQVRDAHRSRLGLGLVNQGGEVTVWGFGGSLVGTFATADFLAAVQSELHVRLVPDDAIVIGRGELPEVHSTPMAVTVDGNYRTIDREFKDYNADYARETGLRLLALAEYLDAHPPVDEAQVKELSTLIWGLPISTNAVKLARALIATGRIEVKP